MGKSKQNKSHAQKDVVSDEEGWSGDQTPASNKAENNNATSKANEVKLKDLSFAERREMQRKEAAEKRKAKQRCFLCGRQGHVRRECPGIDDDGRGESIHKKAKGDPGASQLKKGVKNKGRKLKKEEPDNTVEYPEGFAPPDDSREANEKESGKLVEQPEAFFYYDTGGDSMATLEYIRHGRSKQKISMKEAVAEYQSVLDEAVSTSNYGGRISRALVRPNRPWILSNESPLSGDAIWFVIGLQRDFLYNDNEKEAALAALLETRTENNGKVVGFFSDLDYSEATLTRPGFDKESQIRRLGCTCQAASEAGAPIQIRVLPAGAISRVAEVNPEEAVSYRQVMEHLEAILTEVLAKHSSLKIHLSCWAGEADDMMKILQRFPDNIWIGMDASVTFSKLVRAHECAFELPLDKLLLESGMPSTIPAVIARTKGRNAFNHSGLIPYIAEAVAVEKSKSRETTPDEVARAASANALKVYPELKKGH